MSLKSLVAALLIFDKAIGLSASIRWLSVRQKIGPSEKMPRILSPNPSEGVEANDELRDIAVGLIA